MNRQRLILALVGIPAFLGIIVIWGCQTATEHYDEKAWENALDNKHTLDVRPEKIAEIDAILKNPRLAYLDNEYLYIYESREWTVYVYSRKNYRLVGKFGRNGEGPGEFKMIHNFMAYNDFILVNSPGKNSFFSREGKLIKEERCPPDLIPCIPVGDGFTSDDYEPPPPTGHRTPMTNRKIIWVEPGFKDRKVLFEKKLNIALVLNPNNGRYSFTLFPDTCEFRVYKDRIYIGYSSQEGFYFSIFDSNGDLLYKITRPYQKKKVSNVLKNAILKNPYRLHWNNQILKLDFYTYLPSFSSFEVEDERIYIFQYPENDKMPLLVLNLKGNLLEANLVPFDFQSLQTNSYQVFYNKKNIFKGASYYLQDNTKTNKLELWRLRLTHSQLK